MFCFKCGAEVPNGSKFCEKCGASLADSNVTQTLGGEPVKVVQQPVCAPADASKKKKRKKWPFIFGGTVLLFLLIIIVAIGGGDEPESQLVQSSADVNLSETYTNGEEGFSFKYPSGWKPIDEERMAELIGSEEDDYPLVLLANEIEDMPEENTYIMVSKFDVEQDAIDHLFIDDEQFAETFDKEASIKDTSVTELDGVSARKITYINSDGLWYESYFYAVGSILYRIDFVWKGESAGSSQTFFDAVIGSYKITSDKKNKIVKTDSYNDSPNSTEENEESAVRDRIDIGETQVINDDYGNLKVTLDYAEFSSRNENTYAAGEYVYPDEGNVFLNVVFTVENIGKKPGSMLSAWSKVIYDGEYEFSKEYEEGESTVDIAPLTSPVTSMLIFEVPKEVRETDKALAIYLDENYVNSETVLSFTIRAGSSASDKELIVGDIIPLEEYITYDQTADEMAASLSAVGLPVQYMEEYGEIGSLDRSLIILNTDAGGCEINISYSDSTLYSVCGINPGMSLQEANEILLANGAVDATRPDDTVAWRYTIDGKYSLTMFGASEDKIDISFHCYLDDLTSW